MIVDPVKAALLGQAILEEQLAATRRAHAQTLRELADALDALANHADGAVQRRSMALGLPGGVPLRVIFSDTGPHPLGAVLDAQGNPWTPTEGP